MFYEMNKSIRSHEFRPKGKQRRSKAACTCEPMHVKGTLTWYLCNKISHCKQKFHFFLEFYQVTVMLLYNSFLSTKSCIQTIGFLVASYRLN